MNKAKLLKWTNSVLFISALIQIATGLILYFDLFLPWVRFFSKLHAYNGLLFIVLIIAHLTFNWGWIRANFLRKSAS